MIKYKLIDDKNVFCIFNNTSIPFDPDNTDYQAYLLWCSEGNVAQPAEES